MMIIQKNQLDGWWGRSRKKTEALTTQLSGQSHVLTSSALFRDKVRTDNTPDDDYAELNGVQMGAGRG